LIAFLQNVLDLHDSREISMNDLLVKQWQYKCGCEIIQVLNIFDIVEEGIYLCADHKKLTLGEDKNKWIEITKTIEAKKLGPLFEFMLDKAEEEIDENRV